MAAEEEDDGTGEEQQEEEAERKTPEDDAKRGVEQDAAAAAAVAATAAAEAAAAEEPEAETRTAAAKAAEHESAAAKGEVPADEPRTQPAQAAEASTALVAEPARSSGAPGLQADGDGDKIVEVGGAQYLVDLETFVVMSLSDEPEEVGIWNDETDEIEFFDAMDAQEDNGAEAAAPLVAIEPEPEPEPEPVIAKAAVASNSDQVTKIIEEDDDNLEVEVGGKAYLVDKMNFLVFPLDDVEGEPDDVGTWDEDSRSIVFYDGDDDGVGADATSGTGLQTHSSIVPEGLPLADEDAETLDIFCSATGADEETGRKFITEAAGNLDEAINLFYAAEDFEVDTPAAVASPEEEASAAAAAAGPNAMSPAGDDIVVVFSDVS